MSEYTIPEEYYFRIHHCRPRFKGNVENVLIYMATEITRIGDGPKNEFNNSLNNAIRCFPGNATLKLKTINNRRTEISSFFGLFYEDKNHYNHAMRRAKELAENNDLVEFFKLFLYYFQYPGAHIKGKDVLEQVEAGIHFKPAQYILKLLKTAEEKNGKRCGITKEEACYCIFNDLRCTRDRYLLNYRKDVYDKIPVGLSEERLDLELYKQEQQWEYDIAQQKVKIEEKQKESAANTPQFMELFKEYCSSVTQLSQASLAEYIVRRKAVIELLEKALESTDDGKYSRESQIHSIICPMQITSDDVQFDEMNLWLIDDRLAYHQFLASDQPMKTLPILKSDVTRRMDIAVFDKAISYSAEDDYINAITIVELKRPQRDDLRGDNKNPISQVLRYVSDIKSGKVKKANGRSFGQVENAAFYCYVIADITDSLIEDAEYASLIRTPDREGFFGFNASKGAYIEVISYDKLVRDAKKRNQVLFDKLFRPKGNQVVTLNRE